MHSAPGTSSRHTQHLSRHAGSYHAGSLGVRKLRASANTWSTLVARKTACAVSRHRAGRQAVNVALAPVCSICQAAGRCFRDVIDVSTSDVVASVLPRCNANNTLQDSCIVSFWVTGELSTLCQMAKIPNEPSLRQNSGSCIWHIMQRDLLSVNRRRC